MQFACYSDWDQLPISADELFAQSAKESVFCSRQWFEALTASALDNGQSMILACVVVEDKVKAVMPLLAESGKTWYSLKHRYTPHYFMLLTNEDQGRVLACLAQGLEQLPISGLILEPILATDPRFPAMQNNMEAAGFRCEQLFRHYNWVHRVQGQTFTEYLAQRPARLRNTIARKARKLEREQGYQIRLYCGSEVPHKMADYYTVYRASWKADEQYIELVDDMVARFSHMEWTRLAVLYIQGKPVAAQLWFVHHGKASIFRLSYDEAWKRYSPGSILTCYLMQYVIDVDKVAEIDFLTGNDAYKQDWMSERRECHALSYIKVQQPQAWYEKYMKMLKF